MAVATQFGRGFRLDLHRQRENESMINTPNEKSSARAAKDADARTKRRAVQAQIVAGLQEILEADEQLLGFSRGLISGGLRGKLTVGFEALFAPYINIGLTERRVVLQHVQHESGRPNEILPHSFPLSELHSVGFSDIETFGGEPEGRLSLRLFNDQHFRLRFRAAEQVESAKSISDVFSSLTASRSKARTSPTQSVCPHCDQILDRVSRYCPYCGESIEPSTPTPVPDDTASRAASDASHEAELGAECNLNSPHGAETPETCADESEPSIESIATSAPPEMATEGHETGRRAEQPAEPEHEGDRPL